ncbi:RimK family alpha-L-glutamate ligase [Candidatus Woesearchaeota archaeon]|nr:RimK family alpha-L-glutamate ligase [Candidatus Woesearchaeota archaeon]
MKLCVISLGGVTSKNIAHESKNYFDEVVELNLKNIELCLDDKGFKIKDDVGDLKEFDCIYVRGSHKYALLQRALTRALYKKVYMPIKPNAFTLGHNKLLGSLELQQKGVSIPTSYFVMNSKQAKALLGEINFPIIIKIPEGTQGKGVMFADSESSAKSMIDALDVFNQPYIIQEYIETGDVKSEDLRVIVAGGKVVGAMKRVSKSTDVRANIHADGTGMAVELTPDLEKMSVKAARALGVDIAGVDILSGRKSSVIEVNLSPGLKGIMKYTGKNIARDVAKALFDETKVFQKKKQEKGLIKKVSDENGFDEHYVGSHIERGMLTLPKFVTKSTGFVNGDELIINSKKGEVRITKHHISKDDD